jgi:hypothetical protein
LNKPFRVCFFVGLRLLPQPGKVGVFNSFKSPNRLEFEMQIIYIGLAGEVPASGKGGKARAALAFPDRCKAAKNLVHSEAVVYAIVRYHLKPGSATTAAVVFLDDQLGEFGKWIGSLSLRTKGSSSIELGLVIFDSTAEACADFSLSVQGDLFNETEVKKRIGEAIKKGK